MSSESLNAERKNNQELKLRPINLVVVHCSDSDHKHHDNPETLRKWHVDERGWPDVGYHYIITKDGTVHIGRPIHRSGAHVKGFNSSSIGICLTGKKDFSQGQFDSLKALTDELILNFGLSIIDVIEHNKLDSSKTCPNFNVREKLGFKEQ